jgi:hypothetical protein
LPADPTDAGELGFGGELDLAGELGFGGEAEICTGADAATF